MPSDFSIDSVHRQHDDDMEDLTILFWRNPLPISVNPETKRKYKERFRLRTQIIKHYPYPDEQSEICDMARFDVVWARKILMAERLQEIVQSVRDMYERVLAGQIWYEKHFQNGKIIVRRNFEWEEGNPISVWRGNRLGEILHQTNI